jgi:hypothetical protein
MEIIGTKPKPRVLIWGIEASSDLYEFISKISPTTRIVENDSDLRLIRQAEWDAAISFGEQPRNPSWQEHLKVIQFDGKYITGYMQKNPDSWVQISANRGSVATEFIAHEWPAEIRKLISTSFLPWLQTSYIKDVVTQINMHSLNIVSSDVIHPFVSDADGLPLAARIDVGVQEIWWLPAETPDKPRWILAAFNEWSKSDPGGFPPDPLWIDRPKWQTQAERQAASDLAALEKERDTVLAELQKREIDLVRRLEESRLDADQRDRRLLTAQGNQLVEEVKAALEEIGFIVQDVDAEQAPKGILLEDLRVQDREATNWIALAEVRGYSGGAKVNDFQRIGRFVEHYIRTEGKEPSARWYIVNHNLNTDPDTRLAVLTGASEDVAIFAQSAGLVIDTRVLFVIRDEVRTGIAEQVAAKQHIRDSKGILSWNG